MQVCFRGQGLSAPSAVDLLVVDGDDFPKTCGRVPVEGGRQHGAQDAFLGAVVGQSNAHALRGEPIRRVPGMRSMSPRSRSRRRS